MSERLVMHVEGSNVMHIDTNGYYLERDATKGFIHLKNDTSMVAPHIWLPLVILVLLIAGIIYRRVNQTNKGERQ